MTPKEIQVQIDKLKDQVRSRKESMLRAARNANLQPEQEANRLDLIEIKRLEELL